MKSILLTALIACFNFLNAQTPSWQWATGTTKSTGEDIGKSIATDKEGNTITVGYFSSSNIAFGSITLMNNNTGTSDVFVTKYDDSGNVLWAKSIGGSDGELGLAVQTDNDGNVYVGGGYKSGKLTFGTSTISNDSAPFGDMFLAKYDAMGDEQWIKTAQLGNSSDAITALHTDMNGNVYATGHFQSTSIKFDAITLKNSAAPTQEIFITKYDSKGNVKWAKNLSGSNHDIGNAIASDNNGNVYLCGQYTSKSLSIDNVNLPNSSEGNADIFILKLDPNGVLVWAKRAGGQEGDFPLAISTDKDNNVLMGGYFKSIAISFENKNLTNLDAPFGDFFLVKYDANGNVKWATGAENSQSSDAITGVAVDQSGDIYITGHFQSNMIKFGAEILSNFEAPNQDIFVAKFNGNGIPKWAKSIGGKENDISNALTVDGANNVKIIGNYASSKLAFGFGNLTNSSALSADVFCAKLSSTNGSIEIPLADCRIYPNPFSTTTTLETDIYLSNATITLYNNIGQIVKTLKNVSGNAFQITRDGLKPGLYTIAYHQNGKLLGLGKVIAID